MLTKFKISVIIISKRRIFVFTFGTTQKIKNQYKTVNKEMIEQYVL